jgi:hypothetical protein
MFSQDRVLFEPMGSATYVDPVYYMEKFSHPGGQSEEAKEWIRQIRGMEAAKVVLRDAVDPSEPKTNQGFGGGYQDEWETRYDGDDERESAEEKVYSYSRHSSSHNTW